MNVAWRFRLIGCEDTILFSAFEEAEDVAEVSPVFFCEALLPKVVEVEAQTLGAG